LGFNFGDLGNFGISGNFPSLRGGFIRFHSRTFAAEADFSHFSKSSSLTTRTTARMR
jgi:hypothetical protein